MLDHIFLIDYLLQYTKKKSPSLDILYRFKGKKRFQIEPLLISKSHVNLPTPEETLTTSPVCGA